MESAQQLHNLIVGCVGIKGRGKTYKLREMIPFCPRLAVIDPTAMLFDQVPNGFTQPEEVFAFLGWSQGRESFAFGYCPEEPLGERVADIVPALLTRGDMVVAFDEIPEVCDGGKVPKKIRYLIRVGRHSGLDVVYTGQRFAEIARTITSQTDIFILFQQTEPLDVDALAHRCGREIAERVPKLGPHEFITYDVRQQKEIPFDPAMLAPGSLERSFAHANGQPGDADEEDEEG